MTPDELETLLRRWGRVFSRPPAQEWDEDSSGGSAGLTSALLSRLHVGEGARTPKRRKPFDPLNDIRGMLKLTARGKESRGGSRVWNAPPDIEACEVAALALYRFDTLRGVVLRVEYCIPGRQREKAYTVGQTEGVSRITLRRYRHELDFARAFMAGSLATVTLRRSKARRGFQG